MQDPQEPTNNWRPAIFKLFHHRRRYDSLNENYKEELDNLFGWAIKFKLKGKKLKAVLPINPKQAYDFIFNDLKSFMTCEFFDEENNREDFRNLSKEELYKKFKNKAFNYLQKEYWQEEKRHEELGVCSTIQDKVGAAEKVNEKGESQPQPDRDVPLGDAIREIGGECAETCSAEKHGRLESFPAIKKELRNHGINPKDVVAKKVSVPEHLKESIREIIYNRALIAAGIQCAQINEKDAEIYLDNKINSKKNKKR